MDRRNKSNRYANSRKHQVAIQNLQEKQQERAKSINQTNVFDRNIEELNQLEQQQQSHLADLNQSFAQAPIFLNSISLSTDTTSSIAAQAASTSGWRNEQSNRGQTFDLGDIQMEGNT